MGGLLDILKFSAGSVLWGVLIALAMMALFVFIVRGWWKDALFTPPTYIAGIVLALLLMFQCTMIVGALKIISMTDRYEAIMDNIVDENFSYLDREASREETNEVIHRLVGQVPLLQHYIGSGWSEGITLRQVPHTMAGELKSYMRSYIVRRLLWSLGFVVVLGVIAIKTLGKPGTTRRATATSRSRTNTPAFESRGRVSTRRRRR